MPFYDTHRQQEPALLANKSPYLVASQGGQYTKHIYIGSQRIVSKIGDIESYGLDPRRIEYAGSEGAGEVWQQVGRPQGQLPAGRQLRNVEVLNHEGGHGAEYDRTANNADKAFCEEWNNSHDKKQPMLLTPKCGMNIKSQTKRIPIIPMGL